MIRTLFLFLLSAFEFCQHSNADNTVPVKKVNECKSAVVRKGISLRSIENLLKENNDDHNFCIDDLLSRIQNTKDALVNIVRKKMLTKKKLKKEIEKFNDDMKEIVEKYNNLIENPKLDDISSDEDVLPKASSSAKSHTIVTLDWRKKIRFTGQHNPIQELTSPLTEEHVLEFISENENCTENILEKKDIPDSDIGCQHMLTSSAETSLNSIDKQKELY